MTDFQPWQSRRRRDWRNVRGWIIAIAAIIALASMCALSFAAQAAPLPPRPGTQATLPAPVGRHEMRLYCRNAPHVQAVRNATCRRIGGYR